MDFQQEGRHVGRTALAVGTVPDLAPCPEGLVQGPDVVHHLRLDDVAEQAAGHPVFVVREDVLVLVQTGIDGQRADDGVVRGDACVRVPGQRKVHGDVPSRKLGIHAGAARKILHPSAPACEILRVIALPLVEEREVRSAVLHTVERALEVGGLAGDAFSSGDFAHSAAEADGIGRNDAHSGTLGTELHVPVRPLVEKEGAQVHPHSAAHLLVHVQEGFPAQVMDRIAGVGGAASQGFIGDVDGVFALFRDVRTPDGAGGVL